MGAGSSVTGPAAQEALIGALADPACYRHAVESVRVIETHISYVVLTGQFAYKIKKSLDLGFLDFTTLDARRFFCEEELRLNRRLAPQIYLQVVAIGGSPEKPLLGADGGAIEYAVKMREFPQEALLDRMLDRGELLAEHIDALAEEVATFHGRIERATPAQPYGSVDSIEEPVRQNFAQLGPLLSEAEERGRIEALSHWSLREHAALRPVLEQRHRDGFIRECHGDLHLGNIALVHGKVQVFDCIEFNANLRWIDVMNEIAFLVMDLQERGRADFAWRFLNRYLEETGDYDGVRVLRYYQVYRAMVRAKVARMRAAQTHIGEQESQAALRTYAAYIAFAERLIKPAARALIVMHGVSGSGKTWASQGLLESMGAVRVRSDVERKRLADLRPLDKSGSGIGAGLYAESMTRMTYEVLAGHARSILEAGHTAIADATFLKRWQRDLLRQLATDVGVPFAIVDCLADDREIERRLIERAKARKDASEATPAVMGLQRSSADPLAEEEGRRILFDTRRDSAVELARRIAAAVVNQGGP